jgi:hypothetical protein
MGTLITLIIFEIICYLYSIKYSVRITDSKTPKYRKIRLGFAEISAF